MITRLATCVSALLLVSCGSSPTTPTQPVLSVSVTGNWPFSDSTAVNGQGNALGVASAPGISGTDGKDAGAGWVAVKANGAAIGQVRGTILFDKTVLAFDGYSQADWFKQGGALVQYGVFANTPGEVGLQIDRPSTLTGAAGSGAVVYLRFRAVKAGTSPILWQNPELRIPTGGSLTLVGGSYGGSVTVR